jgi:polysaccharide transporter, PST family
MELSSLLFGIEGFINNYMFIKKLKNKDSKTIIHNTFSLLILQSSLYILPLILLPYLVRVIGIENFGLLAFATATISFFRGIVEYGFNLTATKQISNNKNDNTKLNEIFSSVIISKFIIATISFIILLILISFFEKFQINKNIFIITFLIIFGDVFFPIWFFQGIENMRLITYIQITYKSIFVILVFLFVKEKTDYILVPLLDSIGAIIASFVSLLIIKTKYNISFKFTNITNVFFQIKDAYHVFLSRITVVIYMSINTFLLGIFTNNELVGFYSIAEKIYMAIRGLLLPFTQAIFPYLNRKYNESKYNYYILIKKISFIYLFVLILFAILTFILKDYLVYIVSGKEILISSQVLGIFAISIIFAIGPLGSNFLIIKNEKKTLVKITFICMIVNMIFIYHSIYFFNIIGAAYLFLTIQILQFILQLKYNKELFFHRPNN